MADYNKHLSSLSIADVNDLGIEELRDIVRELRRKNRLLKFEITVRRNEALKNLADKDRLDEILAPYQSDLDQALRSSYATRIPE